MLVAVIAFFLAFAAAIGLAAVYYVHMFQLESYLPVQFSKWLLERAKVNVFSSFFRPSSQRSLQCFGVKVPSHLLSALCS